MSTIEKMLTLQALITIARRTGRKEDKDHFFQVLVDVYSAKALAITYGKKPSYAEDLAQEIFAKFNGYDLGKFPDFYTGDFDHYFIKSCLNHCKTFHRINHKKNTYQELNILYHDSPVSNENDLLELNIDIEYYLSLLPDNQQSVIRYFAEGFSYHEIAALMDANTAKVRNYLQRGRARLRQYRREEREKFDIFWNRNSA